LLTNKLQFLVFLFYSGRELSHALPFQVARIDRKLQKISQEPQDRGTLAHASIYNIELGFTCI